MNAWSTAARLSPVPLPPPVESGAGDLTGSNKPPPPPAKKASTCYTHPVRSVAHTDHL